MRRSIARGLAVAGLTATIGFGAAVPAAAPAVAYDSYTPATLAAKIEWKADLLRSMSTKLATYVVVLTDTQVTTLRTRLGSAAADLDALAVETREADTQEELDARLAEFRAELSSIAPTTRAARQAFYGTYLRHKAFYLSARATALQEKLDAYEAAGEIADADADVVQAAITAARLRIAAARNVLTTSVLGAQIMGDPAAASETLQRATKRLYGAKYWLRTAWSAMYWAVTYG